MHSDYSLHQLQHAISCSQTTCEKAVQQALEQIEKHQECNAFVRVYCKEALRAAKALDQRDRHGRGDLAGAVIGIKDLLCYADHPIEAGSKILEGFVSQFSCTAVQRVLDADAIIIGHQNCDQFGMGSSSEHSVYGPVRNPLDLNKVPGGSSGGSAAAVQTGMCQISLCTDTGGSARQPAAFCGVLGLKPTYGRISRYGMIAHASSFDTIGILARHVSDIAQVLQVIAGADDKDSTVSQMPVSNYLSYSSLASKKYKIAYIQEALSHPGLQSEIRIQTEKSILQFKKQGHTVHSISFPLLNYTIAVYYILVNAEASSNLSRFDGVRYGYRSPHADNLQNMYNATRTEGFGTEVQRRILIGNFVLSSGYQNAWYVKAQKVRRMIVDQFKKLFEQYDFVLMPTAPTTAFAIGEKVQDPVSMYLADFYTVPASVAGLPAISVPYGIDNKGMPIGLQLLAGHMQEAKLLAIAEEMTSVHSKST